MRFVVYSRAGRDRGIGRRTMAAFGPQAVSYTHLTLPTKA